MESYCNNRNSMSCPRGATVCSRDSLGVGNSQTMNRRDHMAQQCRREANLEQCKREINAEQRRGTVNVEQRREASMGKCKREVNVEQRRRQDCSSCCVKEEKKGNCPERNEVKNRSVEVECVCQVNPVVSCHRHDEMEHLGCEFPVVMAYVPWQQWGELYDLEHGLMQGTIFKDLNFIFCGERC